MYAELAAGVCSFLVHECWRDCVCAERCLNRAVQRARDFEIQLFKTANGRGWGVRALVDLPAGKVLGTYTGCVTACYLTL